MTGKRFTNIEHDYENAWIKCNDDGDFMIYAIYKELDESLPSLEDLLNGLADEKDYYQIKSGKCEEELLNLRRENKELKKEIDALKMEIAELRESEKDNYNITDGLW